MKINFGPWVNLISNLSYHVRICDQRILEPEDFHDYFRPRFLIILSFSLLNYLDLSFIKIFKGQFCSIFDLPLLEAHLDKVRGLWIVILAEWHQFAHLSIVPAREVGRKSRRFMKLGHKIFIHVECVHLTFIVLDLIPIFTGRKLANPRSPNEQSENRLITMPALIFEV
jgi:hypothetical protein